MPGCSPLTLAKRAFVKVLLSLAAAHSVSVGVNRDSEEKALLTAYRLVAKKVHPDKGGTKKEFTKLQAAKETWEKALKETAPRGRPRPATADLVERSGPEAAAEEGYRVRAVAVLLTYCGEWTQTLWKSFVLWVQQKLKAWSVQRWCATLEESNAGKLHVHLQLQFSKPVDRLVQFFAWQGRRPNASSHDYLGGGRNRANWQQSVDRAFFYVYADKEGTQRDLEGNVCVEGNYQPAWTKATSRYEVMGKWPETLWKQYKLSHAKYEEYLFLCRDGVLPRKRNLDAVRQRAEEDAEDKEREATAKRVRANTFEPFPEVPEVTAWLALFCEEVDRYPFLVLLGPSRSRKTEFAKSFFKNPLPLVVTANYSTKNRDLLHTDDFLSHRDNRVLVERDTPFAV